MASLSFQRGTEVTPTNSISLMPILIPLSMSIIKISELLMSVSVCLAIRTFAY